MDSITTKTQAEPSRARKESDSGQKKNGELNLSGESSRPTYFHDNHLGKAKSKKLSVVVLVFLLFVLATVCGILFLPKPLYSRSRPITLSEFKDTMEGQANLYSCSKDLIKEMTGEDLTQTYFNSSPDTAIYCLRFSEDDEIVVVLSVAQNEEELKGVMQGVKATEEIINGAGNQIWKRIENNSAIVNIQVKNTMLLVVAKNEDRVKEITKILGYN